MRQAQFPQPAKMRGNPGTYQAVRHVAHGECAARLLNENRSRRIVIVADAWKPMMLNLEVQSAEPLPCRLPVR
jgi:hypothetical protein